MNTTLLIVPYRLSGIRMRMALVSCDIDGGHNTTNKGDYDYELGYEPPRYPVPAIREGWEEGTNLLTGEPVLIHWHQGRYDIG